MFARLLEARAIRDPAWNAWGAGQDVHDGNTSAGQTVNENTALQLLAVYGSVSLISDLLGQLPVDHYRKVGKQRQDVTPRAAWLDQPNPEIDGQDFVGQFVASLLLAGNAFNVVLRNRLGEVAELWPQHPADVQKMRMTAGGPIETYLRGEQFRGELLHTRAFTLPGALLGCNPITYARESIGSGLALQESGSRFFSNGSIPSVVIEAPGGPDTVDAAKVREGFEKFHKGASKAHGVAVLTGGATAKALSISPADAQFLEGRNFSAAEIATMLFRIPPDLIGVTLPHSKDITYQNIEQRWTELRRRCLGYWMTKYEKAMSGLTPRPQYVRLNDDAYLRADLLTQYQTFQVGLANEFLVVNEVRDLIDMPHLPGGDVVKPQAAPVAVSNDNVSKGGDGQPAGEPREMHMHMPDVHVELPPVNVAAPVVNIAPPAVRVDAPIVNVAAPEVHVAPEVRAPDIHIAAPEAPDVHVDVHVPVAPKTFKRLLRGKGGEITGMVEEDER